MKVAEVNAGGGSSAAIELAIIAGPCVVESLEIILRHAERLAKIARSGVSIVFKSSFDKANRTSHHGLFAGPGLEEGLEILAAIKRETGFAVSDRHPRTIAGCGGGRSRRYPADPGASSFVRPTCFTAAALTKAAINLKKGQFLAPADMNAVIGKPNRGQPAHHRDRARLFPSATTICFRYAIVGDHARHSATRWCSMRPIRCNCRAARRRRSGGQREFIAPLARAAVAAVRCDFHGSARGSRSCAQRRP